MEAIIKQLMTTLTPYLIDFALDNRHVVIDFLVIEAEKTDNILDDYIVSALTDYINSL